MLRFRLVSSAPLYSHRYSYGVFLSIYHSEMSKDMTTWCLLLRQLKQSLFSSVTSRKVWMTTKNRLGTMERHVTTRNRLELGHKGQHPEVQFPRGDTQHSLQTPLTKDTPIVYREGRGWSTRMGGLHGNDTDYTIDYEFSIRNCHVQLRKGLQEPTRSTHTPGEV